MFAVGLGKKLTPLDVPDGYTEAANRSLFPLTNGFITWESEHPSWTGKYSYPRFNHHPDRLRS